MKCGIILLGKFKEGYDSQGIRRDYQEYAHAQGLTQPQLAMACGTGVRFIVDLEAGKETCQLGKALNVIQTLGLALDLRAIG